MPDIEVVIRKDTQEGTSPSEKTAVGEKKPDKKSAGLSDLEKKAVQGAIIQVGQQAIMTGISQWGNLTGNYTQQRNISAMISLGGDALTAVSLGPAGAIYIAGKYALEVVTSQIEMSNRLQQHEFVRGRLGMISAKGSRY
jgi:hypothetical protein